MMKILKVVIATEKVRWCQFLTAPNLPCRELDPLDVSALAALFAQVPDPRMKRGVRHGLPAVLTVLTLAVLCGAGNFRQVADRVVERPQPVLAAAGARRHPVLGLWQVPSKDTIRRLVEAIDAEDCDRLVCRWLAARVEPGYGIGLALDGKTARGSGATYDERVVLFSAMRHDQAIVVAQVAAPPGTTEVTQVKRLLADLLMLLASGGHDERVEPR